MLCCQVWQHSQLSRLRWLMVYLPAFYPPTGRQSPRRGSSPSGTSRTFHFVPILGIMAQALRYVLTSSTTRLLDGRAKEKGLGCVYAVEGSSSQRQVISALGVHRIIT